MPLSIDEGKKRVVDLLMSIADSRGVRIRRDDIRWTPPPPDDPDDSYLLIVKDPEEIMGDSWAELSEKHVTHHDSDSEIWSELLTILREDIIDYLRD
jgi:hypothetical protein